MAFAPRPRLPWQPLRDALGPILSPASFDPRKPKHYCPTAARTIADLLGISPRTIHRWVREGIPLYTADRAACAIGLHPLNIWPEWLDLEEDSCSVS